MGPGKKFADLIVVGDGIASRALLYELFKERTTPLDVLCLSASEFSSPCSLSSTATVCLDGITKGHSALGDMLVQAYQNFEIFHEQNRLPGVSKGTHRVELASGATPNDREQFLRRYGNNIEMPCYFIHPHQFLKALEQTRVRYENALVTSFQKSGHLWELKDREGRLYVAPKVVWAVGSWPKAPQGIPPHQSVMGHYLEYSSVQLGDESWSLDIKGEGGLKVIYRAREHELLVGTVSEKSRVETPDWALLTRKLNWAKRRFPEIPWDTLGPHKARVGSRARGKGMQPFWGPVEGQEGLWAVANFYKNGWSYAFLAARQLASALTS